MQDWTEKYRPKKIDQVIGNEKAISILKNWGNNWNIGRIPKKRAVILSGKPGTGKTSSALALANDFGWTTIELNASDARNAQTIKRIATSGALNETFNPDGTFISSKTGGRKLIILDEADNLYERIEKTNNEGDFSDKGGKKAIIDTIKLTNQPIILIVNDYYELIKGTGDQLKNLCQLIQFYETNHAQIVELLKRICIEENILADVKLLGSIADRCKGDIRSAINDLQSISLDKKQIDIKSLDVLGYRDRDKIIFDAIRDVFKSRNIQSTKDITNNLDVPPETFLLWISENLPREYIATEDLIKGFEALSKADIFLGRVYKRQYYGFWSYANDLMNGGVSVAKAHNYGNIKYFSPKWIKDLKSSKSIRSIRDSVIKKISILTHNSNDKTKDFLPYFSHLFRNNTRFASKMKNKLDLTESEVKYILGKEHLNKLKDIMQISEKIDEMQIEIKPDGKEKLKEKKEKKQEIKQPSIFDF